jgi:hypothetical protein
MNTLDPSQSLVSAPVVPLDLPATRAALEVVGRRLVGLLAAVPDPQAPHPRPCLDPGRDQPAYRRRAGALRRLCPWPGPAGAGHRPRPRLRPAHGRRP